MPSCPLTLLFNFGSNLPKIIFGDMLKKQNYHC